jgi:hypothetical protein
MPDRTLHKALKTSATSGGKSPRQRPHITPSLGFLGQTKEHDPDNPSTCDSAKEHSGAHRSSAMTIYQIAADSNTEQQQAKQLGEGRDRIKATPGLGLQKES